MTSAEKVRDSDPPPPPFPLFPTTQNYSILLYPYLPVNEMLVIIHDWALRNPSPLFKKYYLRIFHNTYIWQENKHLTQACLLEKL